MTKRKNRVEIKPPEEFPLGHKFRCQVTPHNFTIYTEDFKPILHFNEDDGFLTAWHAGKEFMSGLGPHEISQFAERLWHWAKEVEAMAEKNRW